MLSLVLLLVDFSSKAKLWLYFRTFIESRQTLTVQRLVFHWTVPELAQECLDDRFGHDGYDGLVSR